MRSRTPKPFRIWLSNNVQGFYYPRRQSMPRGLPSSWDGASNPQPGKLFVFIASWICLAVFSLIVACGLFFIYRY